MHTYLYLAIIFTLGLALVFCLVHMNEKIAALNLQYKGTGRIWPQNGEVLVWRPMIHPADSYSDMGTACQVMQLSSINYQRTIMAAFQMALLDEGWFMVRAEAHQTGVARCHLHLPEDVIKRVAERLAKGSYDEVKIARPELSGPLLPDHTSPEAASAFIRNLLFNSRWAGWVPEPVQKTRRSDSTGFPLKQILIRVSSADGRYPGGDAVRDFLHNQCELLVRDNLTNTRTVSGVWTAAEQTDITFSIVSQYARTPPGWFPDDAENEVPAILVEEQKYRTETHCPGVSIAIQGKGMTPCEYLASALNEVCRRLEAGCGSDYDGNVGYGFVCVRTEPVPA